jgi:hypothetical protein
MTTAPQLDLFLLDDGDEFNRRFCDRPDCRLREVHKVSARRRAR